MVVSRRAVFTILPSLAFAQGREHPTACLGCKHFAGVDEAEANRRGMPFKYYLEDNTPEAVKARENLMCCLSPKVGKTVTEKNFDWLTGTSHEKTYTVYPFASSINTDGNCKYYEERENSERENNEIRSN